MSPIDRRGISSAGVNEAKRHRGAVLMSFVSCQTAKAPAGRGRINLRRLHYTHEKIKCKRANTALRKSPAVVLFSQVQLFNHEHLGKYSFIHIMLKLTSAQKR